MLHRTARVCSFAVAPVIMARVYAADDDSSPKKTHTLRPSDLPIYEQESKIDIEFVEEKQMQFIQHVSSVRQAVWSYLDSVQSSTGLSITSIKDTTAAAKEKYNSAKKYTDDVQSMVKEDTGVMPRAGLITVAGLGGIVLGYKGGFFRKLFYSTGSMAAMASLCYPRQAVDVAIHGWKVSREQAVQLWDNASQSGKKTEDEKAEGITTDKPSVIPAEATNKDKSEELVMTTTDSTKNIKSTKPDKDFGQSKKEDQDLYTTRTS